MSYKFTELPYLFNTVPEQLRDTIIRLLDRNEGHVGNTAADLNVTRRMFLHYVDRLNLRPEVDGIKDKWSLERKRSRTHRAGARRSAGVSTSKEFMDGVRDTPAVAAQTILWAFEEAGGDPSKTAGLLGVSRPVMWSAARLLGIYEDLRRLGERLRLARGTTPLADLRQRLNSRPAASATTGASDSKSV